MQDNCLDEFYTRSQDSFMPPPPNKEHEEVKKKDQPQKTLTEDDALFIATVKIERGKKLIEQLMSEQDLKDTGIGRLTGPEKANLNAWLDPDKVLAPGGQPHGQG